MEIGTSFEFKFEVGIVVWYVAPSSGEVSNSLSMNTKVENGIDISYKKLIIFYFHVIFITKNGRDRESWDLVMLFEMRKFAARLTTFSDNFCGK